MPRCGELAGVCGSEASLRPRATTLSQVLAAVELGAEILPVARLWRGSHLGAAQLLATGSRDEPRHLLHSGQSATVRGGEANRNLAFFVSLSLSRGRLKRVSPPPRPSRLSPAGQADGQAGEREEVHSAQLRAGQHAGPYLPRPGKVDLRRGPRPEAVCQQEGDGTLPSLVLSRWRLHHGRYESDSLARFYFRMRSHEESSLLASSLLSSPLVLSPPAGKIYADSGRLLGVEPHSGHYRPSVANLKGKPRNYFPREKPRIRSSISSLTPHHQLQRSTRIWSRLAPTSA